MEVRTVRRVGEVDAREWDALTGDDDPFVEHAFLHALEESGSVGESSGWHPTHLVVEEDGALVAALPLYVKEHSYGEYIFDWGWADGAHRAGIEYYPKLVSMAPLTPATGRRFLVHPDFDEAKAVSILLDGVLAVADALQVSSAHLLFLNERERAFVIEDGRFMPRLSMQYHWHAEGDATFDEFLGRFRSSMRKKVRKERRVVEEAGLEIRVKEGHELSEEDWRTLRAFYEDTCRRKGSMPYLDRRFFELGPELLRKRALAVMAYQGDTCVAATLNFEKGAHLYGRYWGCREDYDMLHFELCYYQLLERAIRRGATRFEAGAQGGHKLRRGLMPSKVHSAHWIRHPALRDAVQDLLPREAMSVTRQIDELSEHGPFRREP